MKKRLSPPWLAFSASSSSSSARSSCTIPPSAKICALISASLQNSSIYKIVSDYKRIRTKGQGGVTTWLALGLSFPFNHRLKAVHGGFSRQSRSKNHGKQVEIRRQNCAGQRRRWVSASSHHLTSNCEVFHSRLSAQGFT